jgi:histidinol phosphatase-like enzyme (inositol monophosphatase family)
MARLPADLLARLDAFLLTLNAAAGEAILPLFRADHGLDDKGGPGAFDPVTQADRGAEAAIRALIEATFPEHGVIGEEYGRDRDDAEFVWVLDPVDGTRAFIAGLPLWTTLIGLRWQGAPVLGSIGQSFLGEVFIGSPAGSRRIDRDGHQTPLNARRCSSLSTAIIATTDPEACFTETERAAWTRLRAATRLARLGCDAYAYAMVAAGTMDMVVEAGLKCWDIDSAIPLIEGAGGCVTNWHGDKVGSEGGQIVIFGDPALTGPTIDILSKTAL